MQLGQPSIDQLRIFLAVVDEGSFNGAAKRLGRAISAISYGIAQLEALLAMRLFEREGSRRPELTTAGRALLPAARAVAGDMDALLAKARDHHQGLESELTLVIDVMYPAAALAALLKEFIAAFPTVELRVHVEALGGVAAMLLDGRADLGVGGPVVSDYPELNRSVIGAVELVPVAAPDHPLAMMETIQPGVARQHLQLVLSDRSPLTEGREFSVTAARTWRLAAARRDRLGQHAAPCRGGGPRPGRAGGAGPAGKAGARLWPERHLAARLPARPRRLPRAERLSRATGRLSRCQHRHACVNRPGW